MNFKAATVWPSAGSRGFNDLNLVGAYNWVCSPRPCAVARKRSFVEKSSMMESVLPDSCAGAWLTGVQMLVESWVRRVRRRFHARLEQRERFGQTTPLAPFGSWHSDCIR